MNIFTAIPKGDSRTWSDDPVVLLDGRTADAATWGLKYALRGPASLDLTAVATGRTWQTTLTAAASAALVVGDYAWSAILTSGAERITASSGRASITTDLASTAAPFDSRTDAQIYLAICEKAMGTFQSSGKVVEYEISGRKLKYSTVAELRSLQTFWTMKVIGEGHAASVANGQGDPRKLLVRFVRP